MAPGEDSLIPLTALVDKHNVSPPPGLQRYARSKSLERTSRIVEATTRVEVSNVLLAPIALAQANTPTTPMIKPAPHGHLMRGELSLSASSKAHGKRPQKSSPPPPPACVDTIGNREMSSTMTMTTTAGITKKARNQSRRVPRNVTLQEARKKLLDLSTLDINNLINDPKLVSEIAELSKTILDKGSYLLSDNQRSLLTLNQDTMPQMKETLEENNKLLHEVKEKVATFEEAYDEAKIVEVELLEDAKGQEEKLDELHEELRWLEEKRNELSVEIMTMESEQSSTTIAISDARKKVQEARMEKLRWESKERELVHQLAEFKAKFGPVKELPNLF